MDEELEAVRLVLPHAIVRNLSSGRGRSAREGWSRNARSTGNQSQCASACPQGATRRQREPSTRVEKMPRRKRGRNPATVLPSSPSGTNTDSQSKSSSASESDYDARENTILARMSTSQAVGNGDVRKASCVVVFFDLPHGWCTGSVRGLCKTKSECNFDVMYWERDGRTRVYPQLLDGASRRTQSRGMDTPRASAKIVNYSVPNRFATF